jgi:hypothetical protein
MTKSSSNPPTGNCKKKCLLRTIYSTKIVFVTKPPFLLIPLLTDPNLVGDSTEFYNIFIQRPKGGIGKNEIIQTTPLEGAYILISNMYRKLYTYPPPVGGSVILPLPQPTTIQPVLPNMVSCFVGVAIWIGARDRTRGAGGGGGFVGRVLCPLLRSVSGGDVHFFPYHYHMRPLLAMNPRNRIINTADAYPPSFTACSNPDPRPRTPDSPPPPPFPVRRAVSPPTSTRNIGDVRKPERYSIEPTRTNASPSSSSPSSSSSTFDFIRNATIRIADVDVTAGEWGR